MSLVPPRQEGDIERIVWRRVQQEAPDLVGRTFKSFNEMKSALSSGGVKGIVRLLERNEGYRAFGQVIEPETRIYGREPWDRVGYYCGKCEEYIVGPPRITDYDNLGPLSGSRGYTVSCGGCESTISRNPQVFS